MVKKYSSITYNGEYSRKIKNIIEKEIPNFKLSFKSNHSIKNRLFNNKDKKNKLEKSGVYQLSCQDCSSIYIGRTKRSFKQCLKEHERSYNNKEDQKSQFSNHLKESQHTYDFSDLQVVHTCERERLINNLESLEIYKAKFDKSKNLVNLQTDFKNNALFSLLK